MRFEWDPDKARRNLSKHKVSFEEAMTVLYDPLAATFDDQEHSNDECRFITIGYSTKGHLLVVSHSEREDAIRIISARFATARERKRHDT